MSDAPPSPTTAGAPQAPVLGVDQAVRRAGLEQASADAGAPAAAPAPAAPSDSTAPAGPGRAEVLLEQCARHVGRGARSIGRELAERRGLRTVLLGAALTLVALELGAGSALAAPLLVIGVVMLIVGAMGPRLRGHVGLDFGPEGTAFTVHTHIAPPGRRLAPDPDGVTVLQLPPRPRIALAPTGPAARADAGVATDAAPPAPVSADADVVESHGETIELDVAQLRALLEAERASEVRVERTSR